MRSGFFLLIAVAAMTAVAAERIPGGWYFTPAELQGKTAAAEYRTGCPPRVALELAPAAPMAVVTLKLERAIDAPALLSLEGLAVGGAEPAALQVKVNDKLVFAGANSFPSNEWGRMGFTVPRGMLKEGDNTIAIGNTATGEGRIMISEVSLHDPSGDFRDFAAGKKGCFWQQSNQKPLGKVTPADGKVEIVGNPEAKFTGICFSSSLVYPKPAKRAGDSVRIRVKASGSGKLILGCYGYNYARAKDGNQIVPFSGYGKRWDRWGWGGYAGALCDLTDEESVITRTFAKVGNSTALAPLVAVQGGGKAVISDVEIEIVLEKQ